MTEIFNYKTRFVGFVDILGFSSFIRDEIQSERYVTSLFNILSLIIDPKGIFYVGKHIETGEEIEFSFENPTSNGGQLTTISDAIALSYPEYSEKNDVSDPSRILQVLSCLETISDLQASLSVLGILSRGGLSIGKIYHGDQLVVGQGLIRAYEFESRVAVVPRVVIDDRVMDILLSDPIPEHVMGTRSRIGNLISIDDDGHYFVNYLCFRSMGGGIINQKEELPQMLKTIRKRMAAVEEERIKEKLAWMDKYISNAIERYHDDGAVRYLHQNTGTKFDAKYPRDFVNLKYMVDNYLLHCSKHIDTKT